MIIQLSGICSVKCDLCEHAIKLLPTIYLNMRYLIYTVTHHDIKIRI